jgi:hypothetical protein
MPTANEVINPALKLLGVITQGETPSSSESSDARAALNAMLDNWSTERLNVYYVYNFTGTITGGTNSYNIATGGTWNTPRPVRIEAANVIVSSITHPVEIITVSEWASIKEKGASSTIALKMYYDQNSPTGKVYLWPTPSGSATIDLWLYSALSQFADLVTNYDFGTGYLRAMIYNLAVEIAPQFGSALRPEIVEIANQSKAAIRMLNAAEPGAPPPGGQINAVAPMPQAGA